MRFSDRLKDLIKTRGFQSTAAFHRAIVDIFGKEAISLVSTHHLLKHDVSKVWEIHLYQLATVLGVRRLDLVAGTTLDVQTHHETTLFAYNETAKLLLIDHKGPAAILKLVVLKDGRTAKEQDPLNNKEAFKSIYVISGAINLLLWDKDTPQSILIKKNESFSFPSTQLHQFENASKQKTTLLITHYPTNNCFLVAKQKTLPLKREGATNP